MLIHLRPLLQQGLRQGHRIGGAEEPHLPKLPLDVDPAPAGRLDPRQGCLATLRSTGPGRSSSGPGRAICLRTVCMCACMHACVSTHMSGTPRPTLYTQILCACTYHQQKQLHSSVKSLICQVPVPPFPMLVSPISHCSVQFCNFCEPRSQNFPSSGWPDCFGLNFQITRFVLL